MVGYVFVAVTMLANGRSREKWRIKMNKEDKVFKLFEKITMYGTIIFVVITLLCYISLLYLSKNITHTLLFSLIFFGVLSIMYMNTFTTMKLIKQYKGVKNE